MNRRQENESSVSARRYDGSFVVPVLIGVSWFALAIASLAQLSEMGHALAEGRVERERTVNVTATCQNATGVAARTN